jgi:hypothetical protein
LKRVLMVQAAMPTAMVPVIIARLYGGHPWTAVQIALGTTLVGILTIPLWQRAGWPGWAARLAEEFSALWPPRDSGCGSLAARRAERRGGGRRS